MVVLKLLFLDSFFYTFQKPGHFYGSFLSRHSYLNFFFFIQVEFYFSDANICKDKFLLKHVKRNKEGFVSLKLISSFKRLKHLTKDWRQVPSFNLSFFLSFFLIHIYIIFLQGQSINITYSDLCYRLDMPLKRCPKDWRSTTRRQRSEEWIHYPSMMKQVILFTNQKNNISKVTDCPKYPKYLKNIWLLLENLSGRDNATI